jgi:flagellar M-ring protein FliF
VGLDAERGDAIQVSQVAFDTSVADAAKAAADAALEAEQSGAIFNIARQAGIVLLVLAVIMLGVLSLRRQRRTAVDMEMLEARGFGGSVLIERLDENGEPVYATADAIAAGEGATAEEEIVPAYIKSPGSATYDSLRDFATEEPEQVARVLRTWIST